MSKPKTDPQILVERIAAYYTIVKLFPSGADMARELAVANRGTVGNWRDRGVPMEYILLLDVLQLVKKEDLVPSVTNWKMLESKYAKRIGKLVKDVLLIKKTQVTAQSAIQASLGPAIRSEVVKCLNEMGYSTGEDGADAIL